MRQKQVVSIHKPFSGREADLAIYDCRRDRTSFCLHASAALLNPTQRDELGARICEQIGRNRIYKQ